MTGSEDYNGVQGMKLELAFANALPLQTTHVGYFNWK